MLRCTHVGGYIALMGRVIVEAWKCDLCGHIWLVQDGVIPKQCAKCRTRIWNCDGGAAKQPKMIIAKPAKVEKVEREISIEKERPIVIEELEARSAPTQRFSGCSECGALGGMHQKGCKRR